jgi:hypothetical protein
MVVEHVAWLVLRLAGSTEALGGCTLKMTTVTGQLDSTAQTVSAESQSPIGKTPHAESSQSQRDRARHVAGHATIAMAAGVDVELLSIEDRTDFTVDRDGARFIDDGTMLHIPYHWPPTLFRQSKFAETLIRIALAGPCAEIVHCDEPCSVDTTQEDDIDWQLAWNTAKRLWSDENRRLDYLAREIQRTERFLRNEPYWEAVGRISPALLEDGVLNGRQVRQLYEQLTVCSA